jgi:hypothetical protein
LEAKKKVIENDVSLRLISKFAIEIEREREEIDLMNPF